MCSFHKPQSADVKIKHLAVLSVSEKLYLSFLYWVLESKKFKSKE